MGEKITYPIYDKIYNHIKSSNGNELYLQKLYREIENIKIDKESLLSLANKEVKTNGECLSTTFRNVLMMQGFTPRQIDYSMNLVYNVQRRVNFKPLSKKKKMQVIVWHVSRRLRFNRKDTRRIVFDMKRLRYFDIKKNIVSVN